MLCEVRITVRLGLWLGAIVNCAHSRHVYGYLCNAFYGSVHNARVANLGVTKHCTGRTGPKYRSVWYKQESPAIADKPARRLRKVCTVYVRAVGL